MDLDSYTSFRQLFFDVLHCTFDGIEKKPDILDTVAGLLSDKNHFAVTPCSHYARELMARMLRYRPALASRLIGCFDENESVNFISGVKTFPLRDLPEHQPDIVVVAATRFYENHVRRLSDMGISAKKVLAVSSTESALKGLGRNTLARGIRLVSDQLHDEKSRMDYLLIWLSYLLLDESILTLFASKTPYPFRADGIVEYAGYRLEGIFDAVCQQELFQEIYRTEEVSPRRGDTALDLGAYRGDTVAFLERYVGPSGRIFAFEPDACNAGFLTRNNRINGFNNVVCVPKGTYNRNCRCALTATAEGGSALFVLKEGADTDQAQTVDMITVDTFVEQSQLDKVDFIKADIEGCELEMLEGAKRTLDRHRPALAIALYHSLSDLINIPLFLIEQAPDYRLFIRQRSQRPQATVLYATHPN